MATYTIKNAILDLGFVDGCVREYRAKNVEIVEVLEMALDRLEQTVLADPLDPSRIIHDLGFVRGAMWLKPMPGAYSQAMDRLMEFFVEGRVDWYQLPQVWTGREHEDPVLSDDLRDEICTDYAIEGREYAKETAKLAGFEDEFIIDRIVPPKVRYEAPPPKAAPDAVPETAAVGTEVQPKTAVSDPTSGGNGRRELTPEQRAAQSERAKAMHKNKPPLVPDSELPAVKELWEAGVSFDKIGHRYKCSGSHIRNFLTKHGIDPRRTEPGTHKGRPPLSDAEVQTIIDEKAKGTPSKEIGAMIDRSQHEVDVKYSQLKTAGLVPKEHLAPEALAARKQKQNELVSEKMTAHHAGKRAEEGVDQEADSEPETEPLAASTVPSPADRWKPNPIDPSEWGDIQRMLADGRSREAIAGDYDVPVEDLDAFIAERLEETKERHRSKAPPGESPASLPAISGA